MLNRKKLFVILDFILAALLLVLGIYFCIAGKFVFAACEFFLAAFDVIGGYLGFKEYKRLKAQHDHNKKDTGVKNEQD